MTGVRDDDSYALLVGTVAHRAVAQVLDEGLETDRAQRVTQILIAVRNVLAQRTGTVDRAQAVIVDAATATAAYLLRFALPEPWLYRGSEVPLGGGLADLVWHNPRRDLWLVDEIKTGVSRVTEARLRPQIDRYVDGGAARWRTHFVGVRLCAVSKPAHTRLYPPGRRRSVLWTDVVDQVL